MCAGGLVSFSLLQSQELFLDDADKIQYYNCNAPNLWNICYQLLINI